MGLQVVHKGVRRASGPGVPQRYLEPASQCHPRATGSAVAAGAQARLLLRQPKLHVVSSCLRSPPVWPAQLSHAVCSVEHCGQLH
eukprot:359945-Chlamydomonas_euryale.AAC.2